MDMPLTLRLSEAEHERLERRAEASLKDAQPMLSLVLHRIEPTPTFDTPNEQPLPGEERLFAYLGKHGRSLG